MRKSKITMLDMLQERHLAKGNDVGQDRAQQEGKHAADSSGLNCYSHAKC